MKALILETSTEKSCLILAGSSGVEKKRFLVGGPDLSKRLAFEAKQMLEQAPHLIFAGSGPGSYTGVRVGAALAKGLAFGWDIPLYGFCSLEAFIPQREGPFAVLVDARSAGVYALRGSLQGEKISCQAPALISLEEAPDYLQGTQSIVSPMAPLLASRIPHLCIEEASLNFDLLASRAFCKEFQIPLELRYL